MLTRESSPMSEKTISSRTEQSKELYNKVKSVVDGAEYLFTKIPDSETSQRFIAGLELALGKSLSEDAREYIKNTLSYPPRTSDDPHHGKINQEKLIHDIIDFIKYDLDKVE